MTDSAVLLNEYRKRVARILRRARSRPERGNLIIGSEFAPLLKDLRQLSGVQPQVALEVLFGLLEQVGRLALTLSDPEGLLADQIRDLVQLLGRVCSKEFKMAPPRVDVIESMRRLYDLWLDDQEGIYPDLDACLLLAAESPAAASELMRHLRRHIRSLPLVFPGGLGAREDVSRMIAVAERHRAERLMGELLARGGCHEYAVIVARDHFRRSGDALDLVTVLRRADRGKEAIAVCRKALASPRAYHRQRLQEHLEELLEVTGEARDRETRKTLESEFLANPCRKSFDALRKVVQEEQWPQVRKRVLKHLHKHQKAPTMLFSLYVEEGELLEADGLAVTQPVDAAELCRGAELIAEERPDMAAGWLLTAAHRRAAMRRSSIYPQVVKDLLRVAELAAVEGQEASFASALKRFRARFARKTKLMELMDQAGLL